MTYETCKRLAEHFRKIGNVEEAKIYEQRMKERNAKTKKPKNLPKIEDTIKDKET